MRLCIHRTFALSRRSRSPIPALHFVMGSRLFRRLAAGGAVAGAHEMPRPAQLVVIDFRSGGNGLPTGAARCGESGGADHVDTGRSSRGQEISACGFPSSSRMRTGSPDSSVFRSAPAGSRRKAAREMVVNFTVLLTARIPAGACRKSRCAARRGSSARRASLHDR